MDTPALLIGRVSSAELSSGWKQDQIGRRATMTDNNLIGYVSSTWTPVGDLSPKSYDGRVVRDDGLVFGLQAGRTVDVWPWTKVKEVGVASWRIR